MENDHIIVCAYRKRIIILSMAEYVDAPEYLREIDLLRIVFPSFEELVAQYYNGEYVYLVVDLDQQVLAPAKAWVAENPKKRTMYVDDLNGPNIRDTLDTLWYSRGLELYGDDITAEIARRQDETVNTALDRAYNAVYRVIGKALPAFRDNVERRMPGGFDGWEKTLLAYFEAAYMAVRLHDKAHARRACELLDICRVHGCNLGINYAKAYARLREIIDE